MTRHKGVPRRIELRPTLLAVVGIMLSQYVPTMAWRSSTGSFSHLRTSEGRLMLPPKDKICTLPTASTTASSDEVCVGPHER